MCPVSLYCNLSLSVTTGLAFRTGDFVQLYCDNCNYIIGQVVSYNSGTGAMVITPYSFEGTGTCCNWTVRLTGAPGMNGTSGINGGTGTAGTSGIINGTLNYVAKFTPDGTSVGDSIIYNGVTNVGIGTNTPAYKLEVNGTGKFSDVITIEKAGAANAITMQSSIGTNTVYQRFINSGGNYYIGVDNSVGTSLFASGGAAYALSIVTESARPIILGTNNTANLTIASGGAATFSNTVRVNGGELTVYNGASVMFTGVDTGNSYVYFGTNTTNYGISFQASGERMRILSNGNVQIGIPPSDTGEKLQVTGTGRFSGLLNITSTTNYSALKNTNTSGNIYWGIDSSTGSDFTGVAYARFIYSEGAYPLITYVNGSERMRIASTGEATFSSTVMATQFTNTSQVAILLNNSGINNDLRMGSASSQLRVVNAANTSALLTITDLGAATFSNLAGTGTRMVVADSTGLLSTQTIPSGGSISLSAIGSTPNANAATLTGSVLNLEPASASFGGVVTTGTQTFAGAKTFSNNVSLGTIGSGAGTATPLTLNLGDTFSTTAGSNLKLRLFQDNSANIYGIGVSNNQMDFNVPAGGGYKFFTGAATFNGEIISRTNTTTGIQVQSSTGTQSLWIRAGYDSDNTPTPVVSANNITFQSSGSNTGSFSFVTGNTKVLSILSVGITSAVSVVASSFIKTGGTASQFLKADGTIDGNTYYLASNPNGYISASQTYYIGTTSNALNRASAVQTLAGVSVDGTASNLSNTGTVTLATAVETNSITITQPSYTTDEPVKLLNFDWYGNIWSLGNIRSGATASNGFGIFLSSVEKFRFTDGAMTIGANTVLHSGNYNSYSPTLTGGNASGTWGIDITGNAATATYATTAGSAPNGSNANNYYNVTPGEGYGLRFWSSDQYKISMGSSAAYVYGPVTDYSIKTQMDVGSAGRGFTWGREGVAPIAALNGTTGNMQIAGTFNATTGSFSGNITVSSGNATGGGIILADDGDIVDLNDAYCSMRFSSGVRIFSANRGGSAVITLANTGAITATGAISASNFSGSSSGTNTGDQTNISGNAATANYATSAGNADTVDGFHASQSNIGNYIVVRDGNGYIFGNYVNMSDDGNPGAGTAISSFITKQGDNYYRSVSPTNAMVSIRGVASGSWGINITGSAGSSSSTGAITHNENRTDGTYYPVGWFAGTPSPAYSCANVKIQSSTGTLSATKLATTGFDLNGYAQMYGGDFWFRGVSNDGIRTRCAAFGRMLDQDLRAYSIYTNDNGGDVFEIFSERYGLDVRFNRADNLDKNCYRFFHDGFGSLLQAYQGDGQTLGLQISTYGDSLFAGNVVANYSFSDERLKQNIQTIESPLEKIIQLRGVTYEWNEGYRKDEKDYGLVAQEVQKVLPELVKETDRLGSDIKYLNVNYEHIVGLLIEGMKEQQKEIDYLKSKINI